MMLVLLSNELVLRMVMVDSIATASGKDGGVTPQGCLLVNDQWSWKLAKAEEETSNIELIGTNCNRGAAKKPDVVKKGHFSVAKYRGVFGQADGINSNVYQRVYLGVSSLGCIILGG